jgi:myo-inositol 2-dehydrogenase/D-chiro-inositol 1-dehydrogenase
VHGSRYLEHLASDIPGVRLGAICRRDAVAGRRQAEEAGARPYADFVEMIGSGTLDAVCAVVPPELHPAIAEAASAAGMPLLIEKPLAGDLPAARRVLKAAAASRAPLMVAHTLRYNRTVLEVRRRMADLGPIHLVAINQRFEPSGAAGGAASRAWLDERAGGGVILNTGIHEFDMLRFLTGREAISVRCRAARVRTRRTEDLFAAIIDLDREPLVATVDASRAVGGRSGRIEVAGERGQILADQGRGELYLLRGRGVEPVPLPEPVPTVREALLDFARLVRGEIANPIPPLEGARAVAIASACLDSAARDGSPVAVEAVESVVP